MIFLMQTTKVLEACKLRWPEIKISTSLKLSTNKSKKIVMPEEQGNDPFTSSKPEPGIFYNPGG